eukprot:CAMPEP_0198424680 /NCGR_PEP_ID=MMETSP1452-20131203/4005_1 /TAXON_ID=1181717 /ORGANISM="Synchroma pusillum, Strain CCMP3072" /LENGTH=341 /DNA_ID=CAMNT_0044145031 /DNA_START=84 /DNA_END=1109 /DNA_ORIENTATION=-
MAAPSPTVKIGVIGVGRIGKCHLESLSAMPNATVTMIADVWEQGCRDAAAKYHIPNFTLVWQELVTSADVDAVLVCSHSSEHAEQVRMAIENGKKVFCEKPLARELHEIAELAAAVQEHNAFVMVAFQRRFDSNFARIKQATMSGEVGSVLHLPLISRDPAPPPMDYVAQSGGMINDMAIHDIDIANFLTGSECVEVMAYTSCRQNEEIGKAGDIDLAMTILKFSCGAIVTIDNARQTTYGYDQRVELFGTNGMIQSSNRFDNQCTIFDGTSVHGDLPMNFFMDRYKEAYKTEMAAFVKAIADGGPPPCGVAEALAAARIAKAVKKSIDDKRPVQIAEIDA